MTFARATRVLYGTALVLILAGIAPVPGEPRSYPMRPATDSERQQSERDHLLDLLRAQQETQR